MSAPTTGGRTLAARVAWLTAIAVALSGVSVLSVTVLLSDRMIAAREDEALLGAASVLAVELLEPGADALAVSEDETRELVNTGILIAVFRGAERVGGDARLPHVAPGNCEDHAELRVCAASAGALVALAARDRRARDEQRGPLLPAGGLAVLLTSLLGATAAFFIAGAVLAPLARLRAAVEAVPEKAPGQADLGPDEGVAEIDALRGSIRDALLRLDHALDHSRRFARDAAHELRTPLASILGELELVAETLEPEARRDIDRARRRATELAALVERLLILARPHESAWVEEVSPVEVVEHVVDALPSAQSARVEISGDHEARVHGERLLLTAMLGNAIDNALKFSTGTVRVEVEARGDHCEISVEDSGPGIEASLREQVFAPFHRGARARVDEISGHGIGLALIAHVVSAHGGQVRFEDAAVGARLVIVLPVGGSSGAGGSSSG